MDLPLPVSPTIATKSLSAISKDQNCTPNAVRSSVIAIRIAMFRIHDEDFSILEKIYEEYHK